MRPEGEGCRSQAGGEGHTQSGQHRHEEHTPVQTHLAEAGEVLGSQRHDQVRPQKRQEDTQSTAHDALSDNSQQFIRRCSGPAIFELLKPV